MSDEHRLIQGSPRLVEARDGAIERLKDAFSSGYLILEDYESRVSRAAMARSLSELEATVGDLPVPKPSPFTAATTEAESLSLSMVTKTLEGSILRTRKLGIEAAMSKVKVDYREEAPIEGVQEINVRLDMSTLILYLPDDVVVENRVQEDMSTFKEHRNRPCNPKAARTLIRITGTARMSNIRIVRKRHWLLSRKS
jgi:hypothetical protein